MTHRDENVYEKGEYEIHKIQVGIAVTGMQ